MRTRSLVVSVLVAAAVALLCSAALWADPPWRVGRLNLIEGQVSFRPGSLDEWAPATLNYPLTTGDTLWTDQGGRAEVHIGTAAVRLGPSTNLSLLALDDQGIQFRLTQGSVWVRLRALDPDDSFEIATPVASVSLLGPGSYRIDVQEDGTTALLVRAGNAEMANGASSVTASANQAVAVSDADAASFDFSMPLAPDAWETWCVSRDQREDRFASNQYVPPTMVGYEDLDEYGTWRVVPAYGTVWAPRSVPAGWAPYRFGHWAWVEPWGWTWIDDAPWGFAPFHYGRWALVAGGWVWIPGTVVARPVYAPALVVFLGAPGSGAAGVGWFPLGPREVYVPPYRVSTTYVRTVNRGFVVNVNVETIDVTRAVYANRRVSGAVTYVPRQTFVGAQPVARSIIRAPQADVLRAPVTGTSPFLVPQRESVLARPVPSPAGIARPPEQVIGRPVVVRREPPPPQVPFDERQRQIQANARRPLEEAQPPASRGQVVPARPGIRVIGAPRQPPAGQMEGPQAGGRGPARVEDTEDDQRLMRPPQPSVRQPQGGQQQLPQAGQPRVPQGREEIQQPAPQMRAPARPGQPQGGQQQQPGAQMRAPARPGQPQGGPQLPKGREDLQPQQPQGGQAQPQLPKGGQGQPQGGQAQPQLPKGGQGQAQQPKDREDLQPQQPQGGKAQPPGLKQGGAMGQGQSPDRTQAGPDDQGQGQGPAVSPGAGPQKGQPGAGPAKQKKKKLVRDKNGKWIEVDEGDTGGDDSGSN